MIKEIGEFLYLYQSDGNIEESVKAISKYYQEKGLSQSAVDDDLPYIEQGGLYKLWIESIPYSFNHWGDILTDYEDRIVFTEMTELIGLTNILSLFDK